MVEMFRKVDGFIEVNVGMTVAVRGLQFRVKVFRKLFYGFSEAIQGWVFVKILARVTQNTECEHSLISP